MEKNTDKSDTLKKNNYFDIADLLNFDDILDFNLDDLLDFNLDDILDLNIFENE